MKQFLLRNVLFSGSFFDSIKPLLASPDVVLLDSCSGFGALANYSFLGINPFAKFIYENHTSSFYQEDKRIATSQDPFIALKTILKTYFIDASCQATPFIGGAMGYFGYDLGRLLEKMPDISVKTDTFPDMCLMFFDQIVVYDHSNKSVLLCVTDPLKNGEKELEQKLCGLEKIVKPVLNRPMKENCPENDFSVLGLKSNFTIDSYTKAVDKILEYIRQGDIYQANLSQAFDFIFRGESLNLYERLRACSPAPFSAFMRMGERSVLSSSPERFLNVKDGLIETRPIKGTRPRGKTQIEDDALSRELLESEKDRAELLMIVDLERNDLGRVALTGSVHVQDLAVLETYTGVFHLVASVRARLGRRHDLVDLIKASFPGGSITGAPKIRAMEIIEELEPNKRSLYTGSMGYIGYNGNMDLNILIRSIMIDGEHGRFQVGGGIVADSIPRDEYEETLHKAKGMMDSLGAKWEDVNG